MCCYAGQSLVGQFGVIEQMYANVSGWGDVFVPKQTRYKSQTSPAGRELALQIYYGHFILSDNKYLSYYAFKQGGLYEYVCSVAC